MTRIEKLQIGNIISFTYNGIKCMAEVRIIGLKYIFMQLNKHYFGKNETWYAGEHKNFLKSKMKKVNLIK